ncbi:MAG: Mur ligase family protein [Desulfobacterales bacterium]|jgi:UDP-N-acetylmuramoyl-tripeptide--D-alanyl-D-alanine ligase|nr:Mur ligase family protein [Desulfobacterales bacterium]
MKYTLAEAASLFKTPVGRIQFIRGVIYTFWPVLSYLTGLYRRMIVPQMRVITVVGSFGKTTTMRAITSALGYPLPDMPNSNSYGGVAHKLLSTRSGSRHSVIEAGIDGPGQMARYAWMLRPDIAVVTSIGSEHNRSLKALEVTREEKSEMVKALPQSGAAVLNGDDPNVLWMAQRTNARVITFGMAEANDVRASGILLDWPRGTRFKLHVNGKNHDVFVRLIGRNGVYSILAAVAVAMSEGFSIESILPGIQKISPARARLEPVHLESGAILLRDEFKSTLETIDSALDILDEIPARRKIVFLGEISEPVGSTGPIYRRIGERIARTASIAVFVGRNFQRYAAGASRGGFPRNCMINAHHDLLSAAERIKDELKPGDVVLVKGRTEQRLDRISLFLAGRKVCCGIVFCRAPYRCDFCPMLEKGWPGMKDDGKSKKDSV